MKLWVDQQFASDWSPADPFTAVESLSGRIYRQKEGRTTLAFELAGREYFLKIHRGVGWAEIFKNLLQGRAPVLGASNEFAAARKLHELGVDSLTPVAFGERGWNPARQFSFLITESLTGTVDLEEFCADWAARPPTRAVKMALLSKLAQVSRQMHDNGINHRDYYLCHFLLDVASLGAVPKPESIRCYLIDLHRAGMRSRTPLRWRVKDIAGLLFSALDIGLTRRDVLRFIAEYRGMPWRDSLQRDQKMWRAVVRRAMALYRKDHGREPPAPLRQLEQLL